MKKLFLIVCCFCTFSISFGQKNGYQVPPKEMADLLLAKPIPLVNIDSKGAWMLQMERPPYPSVSELSMPEARVAGLRINPDNFSASRVNNITGLSLKNISTGKTYSIGGLPQPLKAGNFKWSPDEQKILFTQSNVKSVDLYVVDIRTAKAKKINKRSLNLTLGSGINWVNDQTILYKVVAISAASAPKRPSVPNGPTIQENLGKAAPSATFEDLIKSPYDEQLFEFYATSQLVSNTNGIETPISKPKMYQEIVLSPDKKYMLVKSIQKPFSYLVPATGFPSTVAIMDLKGNVQHHLADLPSIEGRPSGNDNTQDVDRGFSWRSDEPATITWCHPLDSGLIKKKMEFHDEVYSLSAPFTSQPKPLFKTHLRYSGTVWGNNVLALVYERSRSKQMETVSRYNPSSNTLDKLYDLNVTDGYNDPGQPVLMKNQFGEEVITPLNNGDQILMNNLTGASPNGDLPFLASYDLKTKTNNIIWRCSEGYYEQAEKVIDANKLIVVTRKESKTEVPNYYLKHLNSNESIKQLTFFTNPYPQLDGVSKQKIFYKRDDGVDLTGDLYLPKGYNKDKDGPLPVFIWAYPAEFNSKADAAQVRGSQNQFLTINWASPVFMVTQGYAVLDRAEMPIVAKDGKKPNDTYVEQLKENAEAAINKLSDMGVGDKNRVGVGGHSYGAFMTANLLAHTSLFKAGIARSGAYNRTLTPFGFQNEDRTYWDDPKLYYDMSPFSFANKIKTPILLIHGEADDNPGTFPINSERLFAAIKGFGGTVRFVYLPYEAHSYRGKENLLHMLWEMKNWLDKYVKNAK